MMQQNPYSLNTQLTVCPKQLTGCPKRLAHNLPLVVFLATFVLSSLSPLGVGSQFTLGIAEAQELATEEDEDEGGTEINVKNAEIETVIRIFSRRTKRNYILDERVKGTISIFLPGKVPDQDASEILEAVLNLKGFASVPIGENLWKIVPSKEAIQSTIPTQLKPTGASGQATVTRLIRLKHVSSEEVRELVSPLVASNGLLNAYTGTNSLIVIDTERNIERILGIIGALDVPFSDRELTIVPIKFADAVDIAEKLTQILSEGNDSNAAATSRNDSTADRLAAIRQRIRETASSRSTSGSSGNASAGTSSANSKTVGSRSREPKIIPDERTNSIILVADDGVTAQLRALIAQLDSEVNLGGFRYWVYRCKFADAEELADVMAGLSGGGSGSSRGSLARDPDVISGGGSNLGNRRSNQQSRTQQRLASQQRTPGQSRGSSSQGGVSSAQLDENISITSDPATNSLVIFADRSGYQKVLSLLDQLDVKRRQVLVEALLLEVQVNDATSTGVEWLTSAGGDDGGVLASNQFGNNLQNLFTNPTALSNFSVAAATAGTLTLPGGITIPTQSVILNAAKNNNNLNVLSAPTILATDNQEAEIVVGENVPFLASTSTSGDNLSNTFNQIDRQDVGITLRLTPQISSDDTVRLDIFTEVSDVIDATASSSLGPTTTLRTSQTTIVAKDGQMIVTGGLISDSNSNSEDGTPFLSDVPIIGSLFGQRTNVAQKTNLLIFILPRIVKDQFDARETTIGSADEMERELNRNKLFPPRGDVLRSEAIDNVAEATLDSNESTSTIRPPAPKPLGAAVTQRTSSASKTIRKTQERVAIKIDPEYLTPQLDGETNALALSRQPAQSTSKNESAKNAILVFRLLGSDKKLSPPFSQNIIGNIFAIKLDQDTPESVGAFFSTGNRFNYLIGEDSLQLQRIAAYRDPSDAIADFPELSAHWYSLSPFEIMRIGKGPWQLASSEE